MSAFEASEPPQVERVTLRRVGRNLGFASVRFGVVNLHSLKVEELPSGALRFTPPETEGRDGRRWASYATQAGAIEAVEHELACLWARSA